MNILVLGNGFDLAHGLPTKYTDFLKFVEVIRQVLDAKDEAANHIDWKDMYSKIKELIEINRGNIENNIFSQEQMWRELLEDNVWIDYFLNNPLYQKENWIDFESEISKKIQEIDKKMKSSSTTPLFEIPFFSKYFIDIQERKRIDRDASAEKNIADFNFNVREWDTYIEKYRQEHPISDCLELQNYEKLIDRLELDLNRLIRTLELYLTEYVEKIECNTSTPDMEICKFDAVLSFNYTNTYEKLYDSRKELEYDYIHGQADSSHSISTNNMVLGIDEYLSQERKNKDIELIAFKKYYQRIYKETGCKYKKWIAEIEQQYAEYIDMKSELLERKRNSTDLQNEMKKAALNTILKSRGMIHNVVIFGHSLDVTDGDILRDLILHENVHTTIFYHNKGVMGQQIANLVKVIGQDELIKRTGGSTKTIEFKLQQDMVER